MYVNTKNANYNCEWLEVKKVNQISRGWITLGRSARVVLPHAVVA